MHGIFNYGIQNFKNFIKYSFALYSGETYSRIHPSLYRDKFHRCSRFKCQEHILAYSFKKYSPQRYFFVFFVSPFKNIAKLHHTYIFVLLSFYCLKLKGNKIRRKIKLNLGFHDRKIRDRLKEGQKQTKQQQREWVYCTELAIVDWNVKCGALRDLVPFVQF